MTKFRARVELIAVIKTLVAELYSAKWQQLFG